MTSNPTSNPDSDPIGRAKAQFDVAFRRLESAQERLQALTADPANDGVALRQAQSVYEQARLFWLSSEAALRAAAIAGGRPLAHGRRLVILHGNSHVAESIALLLRLRGFAATVRARNGTDGDRPAEPPSAIIADFEKRPDRLDRFAINRVKTSPGTRMVAMVPQALADCDWREFDEVLLKPVSIDEIVQAVLRYGHA
jgi:hypothetical protein